MAHISLRRFKRSIPHHGTGTESGAVARRSTSGNNLRKEMQNHEKYTLMKKCKKHSHFPLHKAPQTPILLM
jgi:hypothetical protein